MENIKRNAKDLICSNCWNKDNKEINTEYDTQHGEICPKCDKLKTGIIKN